MILAMNLSTMAAAEDSAVPRMLLRQGLSNATPLVQAGKPKAVILYPDADPAYAGLAERINLVIEAAGGVRLQAIAADEVLEDTLFLPDNLAKKHLILLGNLQTNRAFAQLAARFQAYASTDWPGANGYVIRTIVNPLGTKANVIVLGASNRAGVARAVQRFSEVVQSSAGSDGVVIPHQLEVVVNGQLQVDAAPAKTTHGAKTFSGTYQLAETVEQYLKTGSPQRLQRVRDLLVGYLSEHKAPMHHDYGTEAGIRALDQVDTLVLDDEENLVMDNLVLDWVLKIIEEKPYWNPQGKRWSFGGHQSAGTLAFYTAINYLLESGQPNSVARQILETQQQRTREFLNYFSTSFKDKRRDAGWETWHPLTAIPRYALAEKDLAYFKSGNALRVAQRQFYAQHPTDVAAIAAYVLQDGRFLSLAPNGGRLNGWAFPAEGTLWRAPVDLTATSPDFVLGTQVMPVNRIEWEIARDRDPQKGWFTRRPYDDAFHLIGFSNGIAETDTVAVLGGWDVLDEAGDANSLRILRQGGHTFLEPAAGDQRRPRPGHAYFNSLLVTSTAAPQPLDAAAKLVAVHNGNTLGHSITEMPDYNGVAWQRQVFWRRDGYFAVIDEARVLQPGPITLVSQWLSPDQPAFHVDRWTAPTDEGTFNLIVGDPDLVHTQQRWNGGPYDLQQRRHQQVSAGERITFVSLFYVDDETQGQHIEMRRIDPQTVLVRQTRQVEGSEPVYELAIIAGGPCEVGPLVITGEGAFISPMMVHHVNGKVRLGEQTIAASDELPPDQADQLAETLETLWERAAPQPSPTVTDTTTTSTTPRISLGLRGEGQAVKPMEFTPHNDGSVTWHFTEPVHLTAIEGLRTDADTVSLTVWPGDPNVEPVAVQVPVGVRDEWVTYQYGFVARLGIQTFGPLDLRARAVRTPKPVGDPPVGRWILEHWHKQPWNISGHNPHLFNRPLGQDVTFRDAQHHVEYQAIEAVDLKGRPVWVGATTLGELFVLNADGAARWTRPMPAPAADILVADLTGDSQPEIIVTLRDSTVRVFDVEGELLVTINTITDETPSPIYMSAPNVTAVVELSGGDRGLAVATYHQARLYDATGQFITSTKTSGFYLDGIAVVPGGMANPDHAVAVRDNVGGMVSVIGLDTFEPLAQVGTLPGSGLGLMLWPDVTAGRTRLLTVSETGVAMLAWRGERGTSTKGDATLIAGGMEREFVLPLESVCNWSLIEQPGGAPPHIAVATTFGGVMLLDETGRILAQTVAAAQVRDLAATRTADGRTVLLLATDRGVVVLDEQLAVVNEIASTVGCTKLRAATTSDEGLVLALFDDGTSMILRNFMSNIDY